MRRWTQWKLWWRAVIFRKQADRELDAERGNTLALVLSDGTKLALTGAMAGCGWPAAARSGAPTGKHRRHPQQPDPWESKNRDRLE